MDLCDHPGQAHEYLEAIRIAYSW